MKGRKFFWLALTVFTGVLIISCGGASTKLVDTKADPAYRNKPVSDILVIGVTHDEKGRRSFERRFVAQLKGIGLEAVSSADVIPIPADQELEKEGILKAVAEFGNDAVIEGNTSLENCVVMEGAAVHSGANLKSAIIYDNDVLEVEK